MEPASSKSSIDFSRTHLAALAGAVFAGVGIYLLASALTYHLGFPLDDSWIHATYARNLAFTGQWAFRLDHPSAGSTSPLWTLLLTPGFWFQLGPLWWSYVLGAFELLGLAVLTEVAVRRLLASYRPAVPWAGLFVAAEWHMLWASVSGMETLLQALLATSVLVLLATGSRRYLATGLLTGLSVWARPDGLTLAGPVLLALLTVEPSIRAKARAALMFLIGIGALVLPYLVFNLVLSDRPLPNTFYAKQAEYAAWQSQSPLLQVGALLLQLLTGPALLLLPGFITWIVHTVRSRDVRMAAAMLWCGGYLLLYIVRLPPYQHGRYLMPAMPAFFLFGLLGSFDLMGRALTRRWLEVLRRGWQLALPLLTAGFLVLGARSYGQDVGWIETEMVATAKWVAAALPPGAVVAAHDIGALGYFDDHPLIDMAGLVSPEVIPFLRDQVRLRQFLDSRGAQYLIAFPTLYPELTAGLPAVHKSDSPFAVSLGAPAMVVYCWNCR